MKGAFHLVKRAEATLSDSRGYWDAGRELLKKYVV